MAKVFRQPLKPAVTPRTNYIRQESLIQSLGGATSNVTVEYSQNAFEWYLIDISLGTPSQNFTVLFDTGSPYLWVTDARCKTSPDEGRGTSDEDTSCPPEPVPGYKRRTFNDTASTTLMKTEQQANCCYGAGCAFGIFAVDVFRTGDVQVDNMTTGLVDAMRHDSTDFLPVTPMDGIFGAWLNESTFEGFPTSIQQVLQQTDRPLFTIALSGHVGQKAGSGGGFVTYGALDDVNCAQEWTYVDVNDLNSNWYILVDLGQNIASDAKAEYDNNLGVYIVDCDVKGLPDIALTIGGHQYPIPSKEYIIDIELEPGKCVLNIYESEGDVIVGDPFYRTFCTSYDYAEKRVSRAQSPTATR